MNNPEKAAQIPTKMIVGKINGLITTFEGDWNIKDKARSLQLTFTNLIQQRIVYDSDYFETGTWFKTWQPQMEWFSINQGEVANKQGSFFTGVTGGIKLRILAGNGKPEAFIYLGFNNPYSGSYKFFAEVSNVNRPARYGYDSSVNNSPKNSFGAGYRLQAVQAPSSIAQMAFIYQISYA